VVAAALATPAVAEVRVEKTADGKVVVYNVGRAAGEQGGAGGSIAFASAARRAPVEPLIERHSDAQDLDPKLVRAVIQAESAFDQRARSRKGAMGLMQLMPATAVVLAVDDPYDPEENIRGGTAYLRQLVDRYPGRLDLALAAYNAGPGAVDRHGGIPPYAETREYVRRVLALYEGRPVDLEAVAALGAPPRLSRDADHRLVLTNDR
jgi:soluble lytic murein transglycosylase-like protein